MQISLKCCIEILGVHLHPIQVNLSLVQIRHYHKLLWLWFGWWAVDNVSEFMTSNGLQRRIYLYSVSFLHDEDVIILTIQLFLGHVSFVLLHQVNSDLDNVVIVVNVISDK